MHLIHSIKAHHTNNKQTNKQTNKQEQQQNRNA